MESKNIDIQVGGDHYKRFVIQPIEFGIAAGLDMIQGNVLKYTLRHKNKNGAEDLDKAMHLCGMAMEWGLEYTMSNRQRALTEAFVRVNKLDVMTEDVIYYMLDGNWVKTIDAIENIKRCCYGE